MLQVFNFEDDSLPKVRRALMSVSSLLVLTVWADLKLNLSVGVLISDSPANFDPKSFDPAFVLVPLLAYLSFRMILTAFWYLPLTKVEHTKADERVGNLTKALKQYVQEAGDRAAYLAPLQQIEVSEFNQLSNRLYRLENHFNDRLDALDKDQEAVENYRRARVFRTDIDGAAELAAELSEISSSAHLVLQNRNETTQFVGKVVREFGTLFDEINSQKDLVMEFKGEVKDLVQLVSANVGTKNLRSVISSLGALNGDLVKAARRKVCIEISFGLILPMVWSIFALWLARDTLLQIVASVPALALC